MSQATNSKVNPVLNFVSLLKPKQSILTAMAIVVCSTTMLSSTKAFANERMPSDYLADGWNRYIYFPFLQQLSQIDSTPAASDDEKIKCDRFYSKVKAKGEAKINLGIGYYDSSEGEPFSFDYYPDHSSTLAHFDFGMNATIDIAYAEVYRQILTRPCIGHLQICGFNEAGAGQFEKMVTAPDGTKVRAIVQIKNGSYSPEHDKNISIYKDQQSAKSDATTHWFFDGLKTADLAVYNGHSRKGGGPDFSPPKLLPTLHVNYPYYQKATPGLNRLLAGLNASAHPAALMLMSCNSALLFEKKVGKVAPEMSFAGTNAIIPGDLPTKGALAGIDSFLKFQCQAGFTKELTLEPAMLQQLKPLKMK
jgi:hypothetical protein